MNKRLLTTICAALLLASLCVGTSVGAVTLGNGYAKISNYQGSWAHHPSMGSGTQVGFWPDPPYWPQSDAGSIVVTTRNNANPALPPSSDWSQNCLYFQVGGEATPGVTNAFTLTDWRLGGQGYYHVSFDWTTSFAAGGNLMKLDIFFGSIPGSIWSITPGQGVHSGHVDIAMPDVEDVAFRLSVVPEPSSVLALLSGIGALAVFRQLKIRR